MLLKSSEVVVIFLFSSFLLCETLIRAVRIAIENGKLQHLLFRICGREKEEEKEK